MTQHDVRPTHGSGARPAREIDGPLASFDLAEQLDRLRQEPPGNNPDKATITLAKADSFRLVLTSVRGGSTFGGDETNGAIALQVLQGSITVARDGEEAAVREGHLAVVAPGRPWRARADMDSAVLLTLSWPDGGDPAFTD